MSDKPSFFAELKRRNVYKVAVAYAVVGWLLVQAGSILFPTFQAPAWIMKTFRHRRRAWLSHRAHPCMGL